MRTARVAEVVNASQRKPSWYRRQWLAYLPLAPYLTYLMVRHRSLTLFTAANPGIAAGGAVGESKSTILASLQRIHGAVAEYCVVRPDRKRRTRVRAVLRWMKHAGFVFPVVMKPDVGERGWAVALVHTQRDVERYFECVKQSVIVQRYVEGVEAAIFYCRYPDSKRGHIISIAELHYRQATSAGLHTQKSKRARSSSIAFGLGCHHARFTDARQWHTRALARSIDALARAVPGFYFGRFDVRAPSHEALSRGDFLVIELNGALAEAVHIYDPKVSLVDACATLFSQWRIAFEIGAANRSSGAVPTPVWQLTGLLATKVWCVLSASQLRKLSRMCA